MSRTILEDTPPSPQSVESWSTQLPSFTTTDSLEDSGTNQCIVESTTTMAESYYEDYSTSGSEQSVQNVHSLQLAGVWHPKGQKVLVRSRYDGFYYPGMIKESTCGNFLKIILVDQSILEAPYKDVITVGGAEPFPPLIVGDTVLVRVRSSWAPHRHKGTCDFYIPGRVCSLPDRIKPIAVAYSVLAYSGVVVTCPRRYIVRICASMHLEMCKYITAMPASVTTPEQSEISASFLSQLMKTPQQFICYSTQSSMATSSTPTYHMSRGGIVSRKTTMESQSYDTIRAPVKKATESQMCCICSCGIQRMRKFGSSHFDSDEHQLELLMNGWRTKLREKEEQKRRVFQATSWSPVTQGFGNFGSSRTKKDEGSIKSEVELNKSSTATEAVSYNKYILMRCGGSGWYYRAMVKQYLGESWYEVSDTGSNEGSEDLTTYRVLEKDIIFSCGEGTRELELGKTVLSALHPRQECFVPGIVTGMSKDGIFYHIQFHDQMKVPVLYLDVFPLDPTRYDSDVEFIHQKGAARLNTTVVAKRNQDGLFPQGKVVEEVVEGSMYKIEWENGGSQVQHNMHIFGDTTKSKNLRIGDFILAPRSDLRVYVPAVVKYQVKGKFWVRDYTSHCHWVNMKYQKCFWLSSEYFYDAVDCISLRTN